MRPTADYLHVVQNGYRRYGHDDEPLRMIAQAPSTPFAVPHVFVYGTLMRGECRAHLLADGRPLGVARVPGQLLDLGEYPGLAPARASDSWVVGELFEVRALGSLSALLTTLDAVEDFLGWSDLRRSTPRSMYERTLLPADPVEGGPPVSCWTYRLCLRGVHRPTFEAASVIESGDWRRRLRR